MWNKKTSESTGRFRRPDRCRHAATAAHKLCTWLQRWGAGTYGRSWPPLPQLGCVSHLNLMENWSANNAALISPRSASTTRLTADYCQCGWRIWTAIQRYPAQSAMQPPFQSTKIQQQK
jgi:hypothetical protein